MRLQLLSDLHLETEVFEPRPAPGAELLVLAGDIDSIWRELDRFGGWPVPVLATARLRLPALVSRFRREGRPRPPKGCNF